MDTRARAAAEMAVRAWLGKVSPGLPDEIAGRPLLGLLAAIEYQVADAVAQAKQQERNEGQVRLANAVAQAVKERDEQIARLTHDVEHWKEGWPEALQRAERAEATERQQAEEIVRLRAEYAAFSRTVTRLKAEKAAAVAAERERHAQAGGDPDGHYCTICRAEALRAAGES